MTALQRLHSYSFEADQEACQGVADYAPFGKHGSLSVLLSNSYVCRAPLTPVSVYTEMGRSRS